MTIETIQNSFRHCGFGNLDNANPICHSNKSEALLERVENREAFKSVDDDVPCHDDGDNCQEAILDDVVAKRQKTDEEEDDDEQYDETPEPPRLTNREAKKLIDGLRRFFMQEAL